MKIDDIDIELIKAVLNQYHGSKDEKVRQGLRSLLGRHVLGEFLLQVRHYEAWASKAAQEQAKKILPGVSLAQVKLHSCNVREPAALTKEQKKRFVNGNGYDKTFHLEHDPPTMQVADTLLDKPNITAEEIKKKLKPFRLCFITVKENQRLEDKGYRSDRPPEAYKNCGIEAERL